MAIQAVIMAGGAGTRLRPLTCGMPKPLAPLCGAPVMDYTLRLLRRHGYDHAAATLCYRPDDIKNVFGAGRHGVSLSYMTEDTPLGTAGSVLRAAGSGRETLLVLSGDGLTSADLTKALAFHRARGAAATLVLHHVDIPLPYGVVVTDNSGRIERFVEKPDWSRVVSSLVNTGIYILEPEVLSLIPRDKPFDFGRELFPLMLEKKLPLYGYTDENYWCDVGDPRAFLRAQEALLLGQAGFTVLDPGIRASDGVQISANSYIASDAVLAHGAVIEHSCVLSGARIAAGACLHEAIICERARIERGVEAENGCVAGAGASVGAFARLQSGVCLWPGVSIPPYAVIKESVSQPPAVPEIEKSCAHPVTPGQAALLCGALLHSRHAASLVCMHDGGNTAAYHTLLGALAAYGAGRVWAAGRGSVGMLAHAVTNLQADGGLLAGAQGIILLDSAGLYLEDRAAAAVESAAGRQETPAPTLGNGVIRSHASQRASYMSSLAAAFSCASGVTVALNCKDRFLRALARDALTQAGHHIAASSPLTLSLTASSARLLTAKETPSDLQQWLFCARALQKLGKSVYDTEDTGRGEYLPADNSAACQWQKRLMQDPVSRALLMLTLCAQEPFEEALAALPEVNIRALDIPCLSQEKGRVLEALLKQASPRPQGGLHAAIGGAQAFIRPDPVLPLMHVSAAARDAEHAQELCDFFSQQIHSILQKHQI